MREAVEAVVVLEGIPISLLMFCVLTLNLTEKKYIDIDLVLGFLLVSCI